MTDQEKINAYLMGIQAVTKTPVVESEEAKGLLNRVFVEIAELINRYASEAGKL